MFSWGEDYRQSFRRKKGSGVPTSDGVQLLQLSFHIRDLSAAQHLLAFLKDNGEASIIRTQEGSRGKQKFVNCGETIQAVSCSDDVVMLLSDGGKVFSVDPNVTPFTPRPPKALSGIQITQIACGSHHTVALTKGGQVYTWGQDSRGQLGLGSNSGAGSPQHVRTLSSIPVVRISAGGEHSFALSVSGGVFGWGRNDCGQLGLGDTEDRNTPAPVSYLNMKKVVQITCGKEHSVVLTKEGAVFTFGSGRYGQLGHNSFQNELRPRLVAELWGANVTKTACGRYHTLVLTDPMKVYSFGCNDHQQLGREEDSHPSVPLPVQLPICSTNGHRIENIFAGADCSFATWRPKEDGLNSKTNITQQPIERMVAKWTSECNAKLGQMTKEEIHSTFSSASVINRSFLDLSKDKHFQTSPNYPGLDLSLAKGVFENLVYEEVLQVKVEDAVLLLLRSLDSKPVGVEGLRVFLVLIELLHATQKAFGPQSLKLHEEVAAAFQKLPPESLQIIGDWWYSLSPSTMVRHVNVWRTALSALSLPASRCSVKTILLILQNLYKANKKKIPEKTFCLEFSQMFLNEDLLLWRAMSNNNIGDNPPLLLCDFPFIMDLKSKIMVFDMNTQLTQVNKPWSQTLIRKTSTLIFVRGLLLDYQMFEIRSLQQGSITQGNSVFELNLHRASLLEDAFVQLAAAHQTDLKKPLMVHFDGDAKRTLVYMWDFFHHLDIVKRKKGLFMLNDSETMAWFSSRTAEEDKATFHVFGILCGLAFYNNSVVDLPFPLVLFKKLVDAEPTLEDMIEFSPAVGGNLQYILDYKEDNLEDLDITFEINWDETEVNLDVNPEKLVTKENRREFVDAYVNYAFNKSVESVFQEFKRGFFLVCDQQLVKLFRPEELQGVLVGGGVYDWATLKRNTQYELGTDGHPTIRMFWEVFEDLTEEQKKDFLWFLTGSRKVPVLGMGQIRMTIQILSGTNDQHFPQSLTCHAILSLPMYSTKEIMRERLTEALKPERGFRM
ncbi:probable E3 ubiquitin-protein ligase HERC4 [Fundulus heteroclitus]|uniref:probable E3 ubiquitin-protein ligase HERC4 n=1 Tax=Fundulus heteroclitus TaxID=8078 RepID=UPI00165C25C5|nr:probable E3 ubiquitin-protein ligase HERC4 [Fundulus heteroclitus]